MQPVEVFLGFSIFLWNKIFWAGGAKVPHLVPLRVETMYYFWVTDFRSCRFSLHRGVQDVHGLHSLGRHQSNCEGTKKKLGYQRKNWTPKKKLKRSSQHYPMCKMKPSCDKDSTYPLTYLFVVYIIRINQSECSSLLCLKRNQPVSVRHFWVTILVCDFIITCDTCVDILVTNVWSCDLLVVSLWPTCGLIVTHL